MPHKHEEVFKCVCETMGGTFEKRTDMRGFKGQSTREFYKVQGDRVLLCSVRKNDRNYHYAAGLNKDGSIRHVHLQMFSFDDGWQTLGEMSGGGDIDFIDFSSLTEDLDTHTCPMIMYERNEGDRRDTLTINADFPQGKMFAVGGSRTESPHPVYGENSKIVRQGLTIGNERNRHFFKEIHRIEEST